MVRELLASGRYFSMLFVDDLCSGSGNFDMHCSRGSQ